MSGYDLISLLKRQKSDDLSGDILVLDLNGNSLDITGVAFADIADTDGETYEILHLTTE